MQLRPKDGPPLAKEQTIMSKYSVFVGNIGQVYDGDDLDEANEAFDEYVELSQDNYGRVAGEPVTMTCDEGSMREYYGTQSEQDD